MFLKQAGDDLCGAEYKPYAADTGVEGDNAEGCKAHVKFFHRSYANKINLLQFYHGNFQMRNLKFNSSKILT